MSSEIGNIESIEKQLQQARDDLRRISANAEIERLEALIAEKRAQLPAKPAPTTEDTPSGKAQPAMDPGRAAVLQQISETRPELARRFGWDGAQAIRSGRGGR